MNSFDVRIFKKWDIDSSAYLSVEEMTTLTNTLGLTTVPVLEDGFRLPRTVVEALAYADGSSQLYETPREGLVLYATENPDVHFKIISNNFLKSLLVFRPSP